MEAKFGFENGLRITTVNGGGEKVTLLSVKTTVFKTAIEQALVRVTPWGTPEEYLAADQEPTREMWSVANEAVRLVILKRVQNNPRDWAQRVATEVRAHRKRKAGAVVSNEFVKETTNTVINTMRPPIEDQNQKGRRMHTVGAA